MGRFENFGNFGKNRKFWKILIFLCGKFRIFISKVGGKLWRREGYICWKYFQVRWKTIFPVFFSSISIFGENISKPDGKIIFPVFLQVPSSLFASLGKPWLIMESVWQTDDEDAHDEKWCVAKLWLAWWSEPSLGVVCYHLELSRKFLHHLEMSGQFWLGSSRRVFGKPMMRMLTMINNELHWTFPFCEERLWS